MKLVMLKLSYLHKAKALEIEEEAVIVGWLTQYSFKPFLP